MAYNFDNLQQQLQNLQQQYQNLQGYSSQQVQSIPQIQMPVISHQVQYVEGLQGAKLFQQNLPSNSSEIIMDKDENLFYMVSKDANGTPSKKIIVGRFQIEEVEEEPTFLTRKDLDEFKEEIKKLLSQPQTKGKGQEK